MLERFLAVVTSLFVVALFASPVLTEETRPKFPPDETLSVPSLTLTDEQFLRGDTANGVPVTLTGELRFPNWDERLPAVVLLRGSDGAKSSSAFHWGAFLNKMGIATLRLDSFGGRGVDRVAMDQSQLSLFAHDISRRRCARGQPAHRSVAHCCDGLLAWRLRGALHSMRRF